MHKSKSVLEYEMHKIHWNFEIQTDHQIPSGKPDSVIVYKKKKKKTNRIMDFAVLADLRVKIKENEKRNNYLDLARELKKKALEHEDNGDTNCNVCVCLRWVVSSLSVVSPLAKS